MLHETPSAQLVEVLPQVTAFLKRTHGAFIDGKSVTLSTDRLIDVYNPADGNVISRTIAAKEDDVRLAVSSARRALPVWRDLRPADRERCLFRLSELIEAHGEELAQLESINQGKSINHTRAIDVAGSVEYVRYMAGWATKIEGSTLDLSIPIPPDTRNLGFTLREPVGVVGAIVPWNFPMMIALWKIAPALACGCTIVVKPSEDTPLTALRLAELVIEAGIPPGVVNVVPGYGRDAGAALVEHPDVNKITFTGSTEIGRRIGISALQNMTRFALELGGKNPLIVLSDVDLPQIMPGLMGACFLNQGQVCAAASRLYVHRSIYDRFVADLAGAMKGLKLGPGLDPSADIQPLVSRAHVDRVAALVETAGRTAEIVTGGRRPDRSGFYFEPTLVINADAENPSVRDEIFGPVISVTPIADLEEAVALSNASRNGLAASVWTNDLNSALRGIQALEAGTVWVNSHIPVDPNLPFGGFKQSGIGREHGRQMIEQYTELKSVCIPVPR
ncbi:Phenylacetaldehyde dehydrogenase [Paraburkholderia sediminicola]|uniref:Phenylacetaldehyde dehydrogenase n=1 Tax=Paraburkholderia sediminicola TaxID=458836 RepID=A0A6J5CUC5_9BURK|nr:aldehyde dehydrogenase family protein [Paraburkholderia sediminicola]CAB3745502.1 Phenylacetaldehyde dehydrogenase [Paraburkholderia sediminicola]